MGINKNDTPLLVVRAIFTSLIGDKYEGHKLVFTDGSKSEAGVGSAAVMGVEREKVSLFILNNDTYYSRVSTDLTAEVIALRLAARPIWSNFYR